MKIVQINSTCGVGSTGKICMAVSSLLWEEDIENYILYAHRGTDCRGAVNYSSHFYIKLQALKARIFGNNGFNSAAATKRLISELERISPDVIHLHNIHTHDCNVEKLFDYLRGKNIKIFWTFHDCWTFTGYCHYFTLADCNKWQNGCDNCPARASHSWFFDRSRELYERKKKMVSGLDITVITPSQWLADIVGKSFFSDCEIKVINNGIDLSVFKPTASTFRERYGISEEQHVLLGVAFDWGVRKGLDVFSDLAKRLDDSYKIILVGTDDSVDKELPSNIISIHRTNNQKELAEIYTAADVFVNPTREEVFGMVNIESLACGTPVVTFRTGGCPEIVDESCGSVVDVNDVDALEKELVRVCMTKPYNASACRDRATLYDCQKRFAEYVELYKNI